MREIGRKASRATLGLAAVSLLLGTTPATASAPTFTGRITGLDDQYLSLNRATGQLLYLSPLAFSQDGGRMLARVRAAGSSLGNRVSVFPTQPLRQWSLTGQPSLPDALATVLVGAPDFSPVAISDAFTGPARFLPGQDAVLIGRQGGPTAPPMGLDLGTGALRGVVAAAGSALSEDGQTGLVAAPDQALSATHADGSATPLGVAGTPLAASPSGAWLAYGVGAAVGQPFDTEVWAVRGDGSANHRVLTVPPGERVDYTRFNGDDQLRVVHLPTVPGFGRPVAQVDVAAPEAPLSDVSDPFAFVDATLPHTRPSSAGLSAGPRGIDTLDVYYWAPKRLLTVSVACSEIARCRGDVQLTLGGVRLPAVRYDRTGGGLVRARFKLTEAQWRRVVPLFRKTLPLPLSDGSWRNHLVEGVGQAPEGQPPNTTRRLQIRGIAKGMPRPTA